MEQNSIIVKTIIDWIENSHLPLVDLVLSPIGKK